LFAYLRGTVQSKEITGGASDRFILEVAGVGFELSVSRRTLSSLPALGETATVHTALSIKETDWSLFGFLSLEERELFLLMQSVTGIGPKLALALVGNFSARQLAEAILADDQKFITQAPGVGAKVAQRIVLELKSKVEDWYQKRFSAVAPAAQGNSNIAEEVRVILDGLGYTQTEINLALSEARKSDVSEEVEALVRHSLRTLGASAFN
jgi:Holliday junction DNA helicase RuvA